MQSKNYQEILMQGGVGILATDTIYGLVGSALSPKIVQRIYKLRHRNPKKPFIILISSLKDLKLFNIKIDPKTEKILKRLWPNKISIILPCRSKKFFYLHRGTNSLAFRLPKNKNLIQLLKKTGPLVAPSANPEGQPPATTISEAKKYFGNNVDFYLNSRKIKNSPSILIKINKNKISILRQGDFLIK
jgi:L-threonylcarbamoyladenylate synthase